jgi:hypothetical protein
VGEHPEVGVTTARPEGWSAGGPTVLRILVGAQLRRLREAKGITRDTAGWEIRASESKISRMELGRVGFKERDVADLLTLYGISDPGDREAVLSLARDANAPGWWQRYSDVAPNWFQPYIDLEAAASLIRLYHVQFVPGLLQTRDYARAIIRGAPELSSGEELERRVDLRIERQQLLTRPDPPHVWVVLDEAVLHRAIGGRDVLRAQLAALVEATKLPNITLQVVPFDTGKHPGEVQFTLLRYAEEELPDLVFMEQLYSALYLDKREDVDMYAEAMERLCLQAPPPERTVEILESAVRRLDAADG